MFSPRIESDCVWGKEEGDSALSLALQDLKASTGEGTATIPDDFPSEGEVSLREIVE